jgi:hypothetical protein
MAGRLGLPLVVCLMIAMRNSTCDNSDIVCDGKFRGKYEGRTELS